MKWRAAAAGVLSLIVLQVFISGKGPEAAGGMLGWLATGTKRLMSPTVGGLPYAAKAAGKAPAAKPSTSGVSGPNGLPKNPSVVTT
jgi:hypothetical protein